MFGTERAETKQKKVKSGQDSTCAIYREEEVAVHTYSIGGVKFYKKILEIYKQIPGYYN